MKFLFDQNISHRILKTIPSQFSSSSTIKKENLIDWSNRKIWEYTKNHNFVIVTLDSDFNDLTLLLGFPPKIIWLRTGNLNTKLIVELLIIYENEILDFMRNQNLGCFEIYKKQK